MTDSSHQRTVYGEFQRACTRWGDRPFLRSTSSAMAVYGDCAVEYTYASAQRTVERLRASYHELGVRPGDRVALAFDSRLDVYLHLLALNAQGASLVPLNMGSTDSELRHIILHSKSRWTSGAPEHSERLQKLVKTEPRIRYFELRTPNAPDPIEPGYGDENTEAALLYTSGTTGSPKGCILSNDYFVTMGEEYNRLGGLCSVGFEDRLLTPLPPNHMNALATSFMAMLLCGGCVIQADRFHPRTWWQTVREERATIIHYLGVMPAILLKLPESQDDDFSGQVRFGFGAGSDPKHQGLFERRFGFPLIEAWAMTETGGAGIVVANHEPRHVGQRCIGRPPSHVAFRIVDKNEQDVAPNQPGELLVRRRGEEPRKGFFSGYFRDAEATRDGWRGGWWHTGDIVRQGPDGSLFFVDRRKNVIRRSGENISAVEVEAALLQLESVENCAVTSAPDEIRGDEVFAFVVPVDETRVSAHDARDLFDQTLRTLTYYKAPGYIVFVERLPLTSSQKINRGEIKQMANRALLADTPFDLRQFKTRGAS
ncbi:AMP-binding protein [Elongatibacter sediminis]|uniref:AMP-binding protein n=1 Tax=Elongatibacter sediminis TaxID=3119006 RepID=A0AAW9RDA1_9GAMM